jgi:hypothetical protein
MAVVLTTTLKLDGKDKDGKFKPKIVEEGTPFAKLTKAEKKLAKELGLLKQVQDPLPTLDDEIADEEAEETEAEDSEAEGDSEE